MINLFALLLMLGVTSLFSGYKSGKKLSLILLIGATITISILGYDCFCAAQLATGYARETLLFRARGCFDFFIMSVLFLIMALQDVIEGNE